MMVLVNVFGAALSSSGALNKMGLSAEITAYNPTQDDITTMEEDLKSSVSGDITGYDSTDPVFGTIGVIYMGAFEELIAGQFFDSIISPFTALGISTQIFYLILFTSALGLVLMRTKSWGIVMILIMATSYAITPIVMPGAQKYIVLFLIGGFAFILYDVFKSKR